MSFYFILMVGILFCILLYRRYFPMLGIPCKNSIDNKCHIFVLDIRSYNIDANDNLSDRRIPFAYLKRFYKEIPNQPLHVIANDRLDVNLGLRYLRRKGYQIASYQVSNCSCRKER